MKILVGYGYSPPTTGRYLEASLARDHEVTYVGTASAGRPGYPSNVDLVRLVAGQPPPDLFLYIDSDHAAYLPRNIEKLNCPTAAYIIDVHLGPRLRKPLARLFDYVFVAQRDHVDEYRSPGQNVEWLPLACDPSVHRALDLPRIYDVGFVGRADPHEFRTSLLKALGKRFVLNDYGRPYSREEMAIIYNRSRIVFNYAIRGDLNMRVFEAMACGAVLVTNRIQNGLLELFEDGKELVTYGTLGELFERVDYLLDHEAEREAIARAGQGKVLAQHTYGQRAREILTTVFEKSPGARSPLRTATEDDRINLYSDLYSKFRLLDASFDLLKDASGVKSKAIALGRFGETVLRRARHG